MTLQIYADKAVDGEVTPTGLAIPEQTNKEDWAEIGRRLTSARNVTQWYLGDWAAFGQEHFGPAFKEFAGIHGLDYGTLRHLAFVSKAIPPERRREKLAWAYHAEVAQLKLFGQNRWLDKAETENMSAAELRKQIRLQQGDEVANESDGKELRFASKHVDALNEWLSSRPTDFWEDDARRKMWAERLRPIAEEYQKLTALAAV